MSLYFINSLVILKLKNSFSLSNTIIHEKDGCKSKGNEHSMELRLYIAYWEPSKTTKFELVLNLIMGISQLVYIIKYLLILTYEISLISL